MIYKFDFLFKITLSDVGETVVTRKAFHTKELPSQFTFADVDDLIPFGYR